MVEDLGDERYALFDLEAPRVDTDATRAALSTRSSDDALLLPDKTRARFTARLPADLALPPARWRRCAAGAPPSSASTTSSSPTCSAPASP